MYLYENFSCSHIKCLYVRYKNLWSNVFCTTWIRHFQKYWNQVNNFFNNCDFLLNGKFNFEIVLQIFSVYSKTANMNETYCNSTYGQLNPLRLVCDLEMLHSFQLKSKRNRL